MKVLITQPNGKDKLVEAFEKAGADLTHRFGLLNDEVKLIVPTVDEELWFMSHSRDWFNSKGILIAVGPEFAVFTCRDKAEFYRFCWRHGFETPQTMQGRFVAKPRFGKGTRGINFIERNYVVQELVEWPEYSIDYYKDSKATSIIPRLRLNVVNGEAKDGVIVEDERLINEAEKLGRELGLEYHNVMQCFYDGKKIKWSEINPRFGGGSWMTFDKFNSPRRLMEIAS